MLSVAADHAGTALPFPVATVSVAGVVGGMVSAGPNGAAFEAADRLPHGKPKPAAIRADGEPPAPGGGAVSERPPPGAVAAGATGAVFGAGDRLPHGNPKPAAIRADGEPPAPSGEALSNATTVKVCGPAGMPVSVNVVTSGPTRPTATPSRRNS